MSLLGGRRSQSFDPCRLGGSFSCAGCRWALPSPAGARLADLIIIGVGRVSCCGARVDRRVGRRGGGILRSRRRGDRCDAGRGAAGPPTARQQPPPRLNARSPPEMEMASQVGSEETETVHIFQLFSFSVFCWCERITQASQA